MARACWVSLVQRDRQERSHSFGWSLAKFWLYVKCSSFSPQREAESYTGVAHFFLCCPEGWWLYWQEVSSALCSHWPIGTWCLPGLVSIPKFDLRSLIWSVGANPQRRAQKTASCKLLKYFPIVSSFHSSDIEGSLFGHLFVSIIKSNLAPILLFFVFLNIGHKMPFFLSLLMSSFKIFGCFACVLVNSK